MHTPVTRSEILVLSFSALTTDIRRFAADVARRQTSAGVANANRGPTTKTQRSSQHRRHGDGRASADGVTAGCRRRRAAPVLLVVLRAQLVVSRLRMVLKVLQSKRDVQVLRVLQPVLLRVKLLAGSLFSHL